MDRVRIRQLSFFCVVLVTPMCVCLKQHVDVTAFSTPRCAHTHTRAPTRARARARAHACLQKSNNSGRHNLVLVYQHHGFIDYAHFRVAHAHAPCVLKKAGNTVDHQAHTAQRWCSHSELVAPQSLEHIATFHICSNCNIGRKNIKQFFQHD